MGSRSRSNASSDLIGRLWDDESGMALVYVTVMLPVIIGFALLAIDIGRFSTLNSTLQHGADALALAGAAELDMRPDAIERSERAITNLVTTNTALFTASAAEVDSTAITTCYLAALPASDATPIDPGDCLSVAEADIGTSSAAARFVQVIVNPKTYNTIFPATFVGAASNTATTQSEAVAGFEAAVCNFTPLLMCNPFEPTNAPLDTPADVYKDYGLYSHIQLESNRRKQIALKAHDKQWAPGNFGFLEAHAGPGAKELAFSIASTHPQGCFVLDNVSVNTSPGNMETLKKAFNVRFDLYPTGNIGGESATSFPPSVNVRKGYIIAKAPNGNASTDACKDTNPVSAFKKKPSNEFSVAMGLPRDKCHIANNCTAGNTREGDGDWGADNPSGTTDDPTKPDFYQYWRFNHPGRAIPSETDLDIDVDGNGSLGTSAIPNNAPPSRYAVYRYEIAKGWVGDLNANNATTNKDLPQREDGLPHCNAGVATDTPDRRIIYGAIVNCRANNLDGGKNNGIRAVAFGKFFVTEPMQGSSASDTVLYTELVDVAKPGEADSVARDIVQLYR